MFYNEASLINPNNFNVKFPIDGIILSDSEVFYYVGFKESDKNDIIKKLNYSYIMVIDTNCIVIEEFTQQKPSIKIPMEKQLKLLYDVRLMNTTSFFLNKTKVKKYNITSQGYNTKVIPRVQSVGVTIDEFEKEIKSNMNHDLVMIDDFEKYCSSPSPDKKKLTKNKLSDDNIGNFKKTQSETILEEYDVL